MAQRLRLDRDREASHDLNRWLDDPGYGAARHGTDRRYLFGMEPGLSVGAGGGELDIVDEEVICRRQWRVEGVVAVIDRFLGRQSSSAFGR